MQIQKHLTTKLGIEHPIVQAPMILQKPLAPLAAAVSNAGGLGSLGCAEMSIDELEQNIATLRKATDGPFNLNFFLHEAPSFDADLDAQIRLMVRPYYQKLGLGCLRTAGTTGLSRSMQIDSNFSDQNDRRWSVSISAAQPARLSMS